MGDMYGRKALYDSGLNGAAENLDDPAQFYPDLAARDAAAMRGGKTESFNNDMYAALQERADRARYDLAAAKKSGVKGKNLTLLEQQEKIALADADNYLATFNQRYRPQAQAPQAAAPQGPDPVITAALERKRAAQAQGAAGQQPPAGPPAMRQATQPPNIDPALLGRPKAGVTMPGQAPQGQLSLSVKEAARQHPVDLQVLTSQMPRLQPPPVLSPMGQAQQMMQAERPFTGFRNMIPGSNIGQ
jgi:hypothetical protein